jgi:ABC-2 type transport system ATP-binding protein
MPGGQEPVVVTQGLTRQFGRRVAVDQIDLVVPQGSVFGFLGPNGSGKTTTIRLLLGLIKAHAGQISLFGQAMPAAQGKVLHRVGALVEGPAFYPYLSGRDNLARLQAIDKTSNPRTARQRREQALERVGLAAAATKRYRQYSLGMKQRLGIAATLMGSPELLILDEPTNGLDPQGTREIRNLIRQLNGEGATVLISSHLLSEVEQICTHVGIMSQGRLIAQQPLPELRAATAARLRLEVTPSTQQLTEQVLRELNLDAKVKAGGELLVEPGDQPVEAIVRQLVERGVGLRALVPETAALEDIFVELTGAGFDVGG